MRTATRPQLRSYAGEAPQQYANRSKTLIRQNLSFGDVKSVASFVNQDACARILMIERSKMSDFRYPVKKTRGTVHYSLLLYTGELRFLNLAMQYRG
jgi:hypothetical protein